VNRTATFVFFLGDDHWYFDGHFVPGKAADGFRFTSDALQVAQGYGADT